MHQSEIGQAAKSALLAAWIILCLVQCNRAESTPIILPHHQIDVSEKAADDFVDKLDRIARSREPQSAEFTSAELTSYVRIYLADAALQQPAVMVTPQGLYASVSVGKRAPRQVRALFTIRARQGTPHIRVLRATVDGLIVPHLVLRGVDQVANAILEDIAWPIRVEQITLAEGSLVLRVSPHALPTR